MPLFYLTKFCCYLVPGQSDHDISTALALSVNVGKFEVFVVDICGTIIDDVVMMLMGR